MVDRGKKARQREDQGMAALKQLAKMTKFCKACGAIMRKENLGCMIGIRYYCPKGCAED